MQSPREAATLVRYLTSSDFQKARAVQEGYLPTISPLYADNDVTAAVPEVRVFRNAAEKTWIARPSSLAGDKYSTVSKDYYEAVHRILSGQVRPEAALDQFEKELAGLGLK